MAASVGGSSPKGSPAASSVILTAPLGVARPRVSQLQASPTNRRRTPVAGEISSPKYRPMRLSMAGRRSFAGADGGNFHREVRAMGLPTGLRPSHSAPDSL